MKNLIEKQTTRREFVKGVGVGALALGATSVAHSAVSNRGKLGVALVGLGNYATHQLAPALEVSKNAYLAGIVTGTPAKEKVWAEKYNIDSSHIYNYENFDSIADDKAIVGGIAGLSSLSSSAVTR